MTDLTHLNELFALSEDPWHNRTGWYLERKRTILLASLPDARYATAFEPGCGPGAITIGLASRCERLLGIDARRESVAAATERTRHLSNVRIEHGVLPADWPRQQEFDLIVLNEIGLSFDPADWAYLASLVRESLLPEATVVACHWKHDDWRRDPNADDVAGSDAADLRSPAERLAAETLHGLLNSVLGLPRQTKIADQDFILDVWTNRTRSVAEREGLV